MMQRVFDELAFNMTNATMGYIKRIKLRVVGLEERREERSRQLHYSLFLYDNLIGRFGRPVQDWQWQSPKEKFCGGPSFSKENAWFLYLILL